MSVSKEERQQARVDIRSWGADKKRDLVERLLNALDEADSEKAELQAEVNRLHALYYGEREAHNSRGGA